MTDALSADHLTGLIRDATPQACLDYLAPHLPQDRRKLSKTASQLFKAIEQEQFDQMLGKKTAKKTGKSELNVQLESARASIFATATPAEMKKAGWRVCPADELLIECVRRLKPDWIDEWVDDLVESSPHSFSIVRVLWREGLCKKPKSPGYTLGLIAAPHRPFWPDLNPDWTKVDPRTTFAQDRTLAERLKQAPDVLEEDIWRFFEIEGNGEFSLAANDKYIAEDAAWGTALATLCAEGGIDRDRLLDETLNALERDFAQFRAGWFSRFLTSLDPTPEEQAARAGRYLRLLGSAIPPTVSLALKVVTGLHKSGHLAAGDIIDAIGPVLQARQKGTVKSALRLVETILKKNSDLSGRALPVVTDALISDDSQVQAKVLDFLEKLGIEDNSAGQQALRDYGDGIAPSLKSRFEEICGGAAPGPEPVVAPTPVMHVGPAEVVPIASFDELVSGFLQILENPENPIEAERVIDGLARFGTAKPDDFDTRVGPLVKRAEQIIDKTKWEDLRLSLGLLARAFGSNGPGMSPAQVSDRFLRGSWAPGKSQSLSYSFLEVFTNRNFETYANVFEGQTLPMLSAPSDDRGCVAPAVLIARYADYTKAGAAPGKFDLALAMMRLAPEGRAPALKSLAGQDEISKALSFALGADVQPGKTAWLWVAAAAGRQPYKAQPAIAKLAGTGAPDAGQLPCYRLEFEKPNDWLWKRMRTEPSITKTVPPDHLPSLFHLSTAGNQYGDVCGGGVAEIRWASLVWPTNLEPFFSQGVDQFDPDEKLSNSPYAAFVEPTLRPDVALGEMGAMMLAMYMAGADPAVRDLAQEGLITAVEEDRLPLEYMTTVLQTLMFSGYLPIGRWTRAFNSLSKISPRHADYVRQLLTSVMTFDPADPPHDIGGLVELLFELQVMQGQPMQSEPALACLGGVKAGGKLGKFAKKLVAQG